MYPGRALILGFLICPVAITVGFLAGDAAATGLRAILAGVLSAVGVALVIAVWSSSREGSPGGRWSWNRLIVHTILAATGGALGFMPILWVMGRYAQAIG